MAADHWYLSLNRIRSLLIVIILTWSNSVDPDAHVHEVAGYGKRHADYSALAGGVGGLAPLAVLGRYAGRVDDHPALAIKVRLVLVHHLGTEADHVEGAHCVHLQMIWM